MNVICYIDGFNLYHGIRSKGWKRYYWLDLWALAEQFLKPGQSLVEVAYCTTLVKGDPLEQQRQLDFIAALQAVRPQIQVAYGHYLAKPMECYSCGNQYIRHEEKMTDVNIACRMLTDAMDGRMDVALLMSGDSDLVPPVRIIRNRWPHKRIIAVFPPNRVSDALRKECHGSTMIGQEKLRNSLLPEQVEVHPRRTVSRPVDWA